MDFLDTPQYPDSAVSQGFRGIPQFPVLAGSAGIQVLVGIQGSRVILHNKVDTLDTQVRLDIQALAPQLQGQAVTQDLAVLYQESQGFLDLVAKVDTRDFPGVVYPVIQATVVSRGSVVNQDSRGLVQDRGSRAFVVYQVTLDFAVNRVIQVFADDQDLAVTLGGLGLERAGLADIQVDQDTVGTRVDLVFLGTAACLDTVDSRQ